MRGVSEANNSSAEITEAQIGQIKDSVGGAEEFAKVQGYLASQATEAEVTAYNEAIGSGDFNKASKAVADAHAAYLRDIGSEGKMVGGKTAAAAANAYQSEAEMQADMRKPEYKTSQAFRDQVAQKLANSNLFQTR
jgi:peptidyl-tRNA hydrolase